MGRLCILGVVTANNYSCEYNGVWRCLWWLNCKDRHSAQRCVVYELLILLRQILQIPDLHVGTSVITPASHVKNLGVIMDDNFTMEPHINNKMRAAFFKIREISYYRRFLTTSCAKTLIHAYITPKLDYCNGLLYGLPAQQLNRLQSILNTAARLVTMTRKYDHITPILRDLHWLPVNFRVQFKLLFTSLQSFTWPCTILSVQQTLPWT